MTLLPEVPAAISTLDNDKIIGTLEGSMAVGATSPATYTKKENVNLPFSYFYGIYSIDGGTTWLDFNMYHITAGQVDNAIQLPLSISGYFETDPPASPEGTFIISAFNAKGVAYTLLYRVWFIARPDTGSITLGDSEYISAVQSGFNYPKIALIDIEPKTIPAFGAGLHSAVHNLNDIKMVSCFIEREGYRFSQAGDLMDAWSHIKILLNSVDWRIDNSGNPNPINYILHTIVYYD